MVKVIYLQNNRGIITFLQNTTIKKRKAKEVTAAAIIEENDMPAAKKAKSAPATVRRSKRKRK